MKRLLVTGGRGFIGRHCLEPAIAAGYEVHATLTQGTVPDDLATLDLRWHSADLLVPGACEDLVMKLRPSHVLHAAWETTHGSYWTSPNNLSWLALGARFLAAFAACGGQRFVSVGTCAEYDWSEGHLVEGETPDNPVTFYGRIKLAHHHALMAAAEQIGFSAATGRIFFGYGPHENPKRIIPYACQRLAAGQPAKFASGHLVRDFMHANDIGRGFVALLDSELGGICNVSSGKAVLLADIVNEIGRLSGRPELVHLGALPERAGDPLELVGANSKLKGTGWRPRMTLATGLEETYWWWESHATDDRPPLGGPIGMLV